MLKRIPKSDISIRPFKAYKEWSFDNNSSEISLLYAEDGNFLYDNITSDGGLSFQQRALYGQLKSQFYNGLEDNPFSSFGEKNNIYDNNVKSKDRFLSGSAKVISIPQKYIGEGIKKGSFYLSSGNDPYIDDNNGNLVSAAGKSELLFSTMDVSGSTFQFDSTSGLAFTASIDNYFIDIQNSIFTVVLGGITYNAELVSVNFDNGVIFLKNADFLPSLKLGNIFYSQGLAVITRNLDSALLSNWSLNYKSTKTIYEHEYLLVVEQDEFNVSTNPSAVKNIGRETEFITGTDGNRYKVVTNPGVNYIRKKSILPNGDVLDYRYSGSIGNSLAGFEHYEMSSSVDITGSFLTPMITTIGLYDDNYDLVAVAKLPQPLKSENDIPLNFIVRFDT